MYVCFYVCVCERVCVYVREYRGNESGLGGTHGRAIFGMGATKHIRKTGKSVCERARGRERRCRKRRRDPHGERERERKGETHMERERERERDGERPEARVT